MDLKTCRDCAHLRVERDKLVCAAVQAMQQLDVVLGEYVKPSAYQMRASKGKCGPEGKLWEERPNNVQEANEYVEHAAANVREVVSMREYYGPKFARLGAAWMGAARWVIGLPGRGVAAVVAGIGGLALGVAMMTGAVQPTEPAKPAPVPDGKADGVIEPVKEDTGPAEPAPTPPKVVEVEQEPAKPDTPEGKLIPFESPRSAQDEAKLGKMVVMAAIALVVGAVVANEIGRPQLPTRAVSRAEMAPCSSQMSVWRMGRETCCPKGEGRCYPCIPTYH